MTICCPHCGNAFAASAAPATLACPECQHRFPNLLPAVDDDDPPIPARLRDDSKPISIVENEEFVRFTVKIFRWMMVAFVANLVAGVFIYAPTYVQQFDVMFGGRQDLGTMLFNMLFQWLFPLVVCVQVIGPICLKRRESPAMLHVSLVMGVVAACWWVGVGVYCWMQPTTMMRILGSGAYVTAAISVLCVCFAYPLVLNADFQARFSEAAERKKEDQERRKRLARRRREAQYDDDDYDD